VPIAEIRRRFQLDATDGTLLSDDDGIIHIGLPDQAARALLDLKKKGKIGLEFAPEFELRGHDEIAVLLQSFNRMRRSLANAMQMLESSM